MLQAVAHPRSTIVALTERGELFDSEAFAQWIGRMRDSGARDMAFLVGSASGLGEAALAAAHVRMALSRLTFPHELVLPILAEQLYRALSILKGTPYHRA